jgi:hypothetical protein
MRNRSDSDVNEAWANEFEPLTGQERTVPGEGSVKNNSKLDQVSIGKPISTFVAGILYSIF